MNATIEADIAPTKREPTTSHSQPSSAAKVKVGKPFRQGLTDLLQRPELQDALKGIRADAREYKSNRLKELLSGVRVTALPDANGMERIQHNRQDAAPPHSSFLNAKADENAGGPPKVFGFDDLYQFAHAHAEGAGDGRTIRDDVVIGILASTFAPFLLDTNFEYDWRFDHQSATYRFEYSPPAAGLYRFSALMFANGIYSVVANDGWPDSDAAKAYISGVLKAPNSGPAGYGDHRAAVPISVEGDNIEVKAKAFSEFAELTATVQAAAGDVITIEASWHLLASAYGDDSFADIDCSQATGGGLYCFPLQVTPV